MTIEEFVKKFDDFTKWDSRNQIDHIAYFLTTEKGLTSFTAKDIEVCFSELSLRYYQRTPQYLSENANDTKIGKYIKQTSGYRLERKTYDEIDIIVKNEPTKIAVSQQLIDLVDLIKNTNEQEFLIEAINCYRVEAYRATIVLIWLLTLDHLQNYIFGSKLNDFNTALAKSPDKKISKIVSYDDFSDLKESKLIEVTRSAGIISNDVRKILDEKLGIRNSAAHPSGIKFTSHKATEFIMDLINNVVLKY